MKWMARSAAMAGAALIGWAVYGGSQLEWGIALPWEDKAYDKVPSSTERMTDRMVERATGVEVERPYRDDYVERDVGLAPKAPKATRAREAREAAEAPKARQAPKARRAPSARKARQAPKARTARKAPTARKARKAPKAPRAGE